MNELQKPNDIFVATLNAPDATAMDLLLNNITASNTSLLTPEEYKQTPFVLKQYSDEQGNFNQTKFLLDYTKAYDKYQELTDAKAYKNLQDYLEYSPTNRFAPEGAKKKDVGTEYTKIKNPLQQSWSTEGINEVSDPTITKKEAAQSNYVFDPESGKFLDFTPETASLGKKIFGDTLVYAVWQEDGEHEDPETGQLVKHQKGEWKTDKDGNYYTEILGNRDIKELQVVALGDILTEEGSLANKIDYFDSDGLDKSAFGIAAKVATQAIPYFIPYIGPYYAAFQTSMGLASVLPTFFKASLNMFDGGQDHESLTRAENWFRKFGDSKSEKGESSFFSLESVAGLVGDTVTQLFQQLSAAKAAKWFMKMPEAPIAEKFANQADYIKAVEKYLDAAKKYNKLQGSLSLGYMGLTSAADVYNDALNAGYDRLAAGITALASASALYGIMNFNGTTRGVGNWFLKTTTGHDEAVERGVIRKIAKEQMQQMSQAVKDAQKGNKVPLMKSLKDFNWKVLNKLDDIVNILAVGALDSALVEGAEEVSEEVIQDTVKGIVDGLSATGLWKQNGSFYDQETWEQRGKRYLETFLGGAGGGAIFHGVGKLQRKLDPKAPKEIDYTLTDAILDGRYGEIEQELKNVKKFFNSELSNSLAEVNGKQIYLSSSTTGQSQADVIYNAALKDIQKQNTLILRAVSSINYDPENQTHHFLSKSYADELNKSGFNEKIVYADWKDIISKQVNAQKAVIDLLKRYDEATDVATKNSIKKDLDNATSTLLDLDKLIADWDSGEQAAKYTRWGFFLTNPVWREKLKLDKGSYTRVTYDKGYNELEDDPDGTKQGLTKQKVDREFEAFLVANYSRNAQGLRERLEAVDKLYMKGMSIVSKELLDFVNNDNNKLWLKHTASYTINPDTNERVYEDKPLALDDSARIQDAEDAENTINIAQLLGDNPKSFAFSVRRKFDLASKLEDKGYINLNDFNEELKKVVRQYINTTAAYTTINTWNKDNVAILLDSINQKIAENDLSIQFVKRINELLTTQNQNSNQAVFQGNLNKRIKVNLDGLVNDPLTMKTSLKSVLDAIEDSDAFIDEELFKELEKAANIEILQLRKDKIKSIFSEDIENLEGIPSYLEYLFQVVNFLGGNNEWGINFKDGSEVDLTSGINLINIDKNNILDHIEDLKQLSNYLKHGVEINGQITELSAWPEIESVELLDANGNSYEEITKEAILDYVNAIDKLIEAAESEEVIPKEFNDKWLQIKNKAHLPNPLLKAITKVMRTFGNNNLGAIEWLWDLANGIQNGLPVNITELDYLDFTRALTFIQEMMTGACEQNGYQIAFKKDDLGRIQYEENGTPEIIDQDSFTVSLNNLMLNHVIMYNGVSEDDARLLFPVFKLNEVDNLRRTVMNMQERLDLLIKVQLDLSLLELSNDIEIRKLTNKQFAEFLSTNELDLSIANAAKIKLGVVKQFDVDSPEDYISESLQNIYQLLLNITDTNNLTISDVKIKAVEALMDLMKNSIKLEKCNIGNLKNNPTNISNFIFNQIVDSIAAPTKEILTKFKQGIEGKALNPLFGLESAVKHLIAKHIGDKEVYKKVLSTLNENKLPMELSDITFLSGFAGTGKSTMIGVYLDAVKPNKVILTAPTTDKVKDLHKILIPNGTTLVNKDKTEETVFDVVPKVLKYQLAIDNLLQETLKNDPNAESFTVKITELLDIELTINIDRGSSGSLVGIHLDDSSLSALSRWIALKKNDFESFKDATLIIDEATHLNPVSLLILQEISKQNNTEIITVGDESQLGFFTSVNDTDFGLNITNIACDKIFPLSVSQRAANSGKGNNQKIAQAASISVNIDFDYSENIAFDLVKSHYSSPLKYNGLLGDQVALESIAFIRALKEMALAVNNGKSILFIVEDNPGSTTEIDTLKLQLTDAGFPANIVNDDTNFKTVKNALGAEADLCVIYNLKNRDFEVSGNSLNLKNVDIDAAKMYTALSRSKEFSLIYEPSQDGLFKKYNAKSVKDGNVTITRANDDVNSERTLKRVLLLLDIIDNIPDITFANINLPQVPTTPTLTSPSTSSTSSTNTNSSTTNLTNNSGVQNLSNNLLLATPQAGSSLTNTTLNPSTQLGNSNNLLQSNQSATPTEEVELIGLIDDELYEEEDSPNNELDTKINGDSKIAKLMRLLLKKINALHENAAAITTSYMRTGIPLSDMEDLYTTANNNLAINYKLQYIYDNSEEDERDKDLLGFWYANRNQDWKLEKLLLEFLKTRNEVLYLNNIDNANIRIKKKTDRDTWFFKVGNKENKKTNETIITLIKKKNGVWFTCGEYLYNNSTEGKESVWLSKSYQEMYNKYDNGGKNPMYFSLKTGDSKQIQASKNTANNYYKKRRKLQKDKINKICNYFNDSAIMPITGLRDFNVNPGDQNSLYVDEQLATLGRMHYNKLLKLGYECVEEIKSIDGLKNNINDLRFEEKGLEKVIERNKLTEGAHYYIIRPIGGGDNAPKAVVIAKNVYSGTVYKYMTTCNYNTLTNFPRSYAFTCAFSYLKKISGYTGELYTGNDTNVDFIKNSITDFANYLIKLDPSKNTSLVNLGLWMLNNINKFTVNLRTTKSGKSYIDTSKNEFYSEFLKYAKDILDDDSSKNFAYTYGDKIDNLIVEKFFEAPYIVQDLDALNINMEGSNKASDFPLEEVSSPELTVVQIKPEESIITPLSKNNTIQLVKEYKVKNDSYEEGERVFNELVEDGYLHEYEDRDLKVLISDINNLKKNKIKIDATTVNALIDIVEKLMPSAADSNKVSTVFAELLSIC